MSTIKRIIDVKPSHRRGYVVCELRYPNGRAETIEVSAADYKLHRMKEDFDDAKMNMKIVQEFERMAYGQGYSQAIEDMKKKKDRKCGIISQLIFWFQSTHLRKV